MYHEFPCFPGYTGNDDSKRNHMKKWLILALALVMISGCSTKKVWKWIDEMEWERDDQTIQIMDFLPK
jgi:hypothetical protein